MRELFSVLSEQVTVSSELGVMREALVSRTGGCGLRVVDGNRAGFAFASSPKLLPKDISPTGDFYGFGRDGRAVFNDRRGVSCDDLVEKVRGMISELDGVSANFAGADFSRTKASIRNPYESLTETICQISADAFVSTPTSVGLGYAASRKKIDFLKAARQAKEMALASEDPGKPKTGRMGVTLRPYAAGSFVDFLTDALSGREVIAGRSPLAGKLGQFVSNLRMVDDPLMKEGTESRGFDDEGVKSRRKVLIDGELIQYLHTIETAKRLGGIPGNATRGYSSLPVPGESNITVSGKRGEEAGLVVEWVSGAHTIAPSGEFAVEAKNAYQDGKPVANLMVCGNVFEMIKDVELCGKLENLGGLFTRSWTVELDVVA